jgi:nucleoside 2-deoxyribosyltransferase
MTRTGSAYAAVAAFRLREMSTAPTNKPCPICKLEQENVEVWDYGERITLDCARCGEYTITATAAAVAERRTLGPKLSAWIRDRNESGTEVPEINSRTLDEIEKSLPDYRVSEKQLLLLRALERKTEFAGKAVEIVPEFDFPLAWAGSEAEFIYLVKALQQRTLVQLAGGSPDINSLVFNLEITPEGWDELEANARTAIISDQAFVAMSFAPELVAAWEQGIRPALLKAQYRPYRIDSTPHIDRIDAKIVSEIRNSRILVADVTGQRSGVYFEAGFAIGLGIPVFWSVRRDDLPNVHFDTRQYNHIVWDNEAHLAEQLHAFVTAIAGKGGADN